MVGGSFDYVASLVASLFQETTGLEEKPLVAVTELLVARIATTIFVTSMTVNDTAAKLMSFCIGLSVLQ